MKVLFSVSSVLAYSVIEITVQLRTLQDQGDLYRFLRRLLSLHQNTPSVQ